MYIKNIKYLSLILLIFLISVIAGCTTMKVQLDSGTIKIQRNEKIAYFKNSFSERDFNVSYIIPRAIYKNITNENADKFREVEKIEEVQIAAFCVENIKKKTGSEVVIIDSKLNVADFDILDKISKDIELKIADELRKADADYAFIPVMRMSSEKSWGFGQSAENRFESKIYIFNKDVKVIGKGYISTNEEWIDPKDTTMYQILIKSSKPLYKQFIDKLFQ
jgi:hypothetical protein